ncbi:MAG TPA: hypothetical protein PLW09_13005 [Candidatus Kapabacteria bacterium]|nr:hypothetical protein [Candidatus Kapabacteria bacterium]
MADTETIEFFRVSSIALSPHTTESHTSINNYKAKIRDSLLYSKFFLTILGNLSKKGIFFLNNHYSVQT